MKSHKQKINNSNITSRAPESFARTCETVYWLAYSLWKSNFWHQLLIGSVIPFLRINDFKNDFDCKVNEMLQEHELHQKQFNALRLLLEKEEHLHQNIALINEMRRAILFSYSNK